jgi:hypothetical protein
MQKAAVAAFPPDWTLLLSLDAEVISLGRRGSEAVRMVVEGTRARLRRAHVRPYELRIDGLRRGAFEDVSDAISSARIAKQERPVALIAVADRSTGHVVMELRP